MDTPLCTAELEPTMKRLKDNRLGTTKSVQRSSLMFTIKEEDLILGLKTLRIFFSNPDTESKTIRHPTDKLASTTTRTEIQTQIDSITKADHVIPGTMEEITVSKLSITSMLDQRIPPLKAIQTFRRATTYLHPIQIVLLTIRDKI